MIAFLNVLALEHAPEIFGPVPLTEPGLTDQAWFLPALALAALLLVALLALLTLRLRRRARTAKNPARELRLRLELLGAANPSGAFFLELSSIMREALGLCFGISAEPRTVRELQAAVEAGDNFGRAQIALGVLRQCEAALFSGSLPEDAKPLLSDADIALRALLLNAFAASAREDLVR